MRGDVAGLRDGDVAPHRQRQRQQDGDGVEELGEVRVEEHQHRTPPRVALQPTGVTPQVAVRAERNVLDLRGNSRKSLLSQHLNHAS